MARLAARRTAAGDAAARHGAALQARVNIGAVLRQALAQSGIDPAAVAMLRVGDAAVHELAEPRDKPARPAANPPLDGDPEPDPFAALFEAKMEDLVRRYRDRRDIDLAHTSLAEALAWGIAHLESRPPG
ncbi:MAG TPA: hypothetical protein VGM07_12275 [Stellaceae bacterium]